MSPVEGRERRSSNKPKPTISAFDFLKNALQKISQTTTKKTHKDHQRAYREKKLATDHSFRELDNLRKRNERASWTDKQKDRNREQSRVRQKAYRERQKAKKMADTANTKPTRISHNKKEGAN